MKKIVCLGDSMTEGCFELYETSYGFDTVRDRESGYVSLLGKLLDGRYEVINAGVNGNNSRMAKERVESDVIAHRPNFCVVCLGLNDVLDTAERHEANMTAIFTALTENGIAPVLLTPPDVCSYVAPDTLPCAVKAATAVAKARNEGKLSLMVGNDRRLAARFGAPVADLYAACEALEKTGCDMTMRLCNRINHPSREDHRLIAAMLYGLFV